MHPLKSWRLVLFDSFRIERDGEVVATFQNRRQEALLAYLALHPGQVVERKAAAAALWPDKSESLAANRLTEVLLRLRRLLDEIEVPDSAILHPRRVLQLNPAMPTDLDEFLALAAETERVQSLDPARAAQIEASMTRIYGSGLLPLFLDPWLEPERERMDAILEQSLERCRARAGVMATVDSYDLMPLPPSRTQREDTGDGGRIEIPDDLGSLGDLPKTTPADPLHRRLREHVELVEEASVHLWGRERESWSKVIRKSYDAVLESIELALAKNLSEPAARLVGAMWPYWMEYEGAGQGRIMLERVLLSSLERGGAIYAQLLHGSGVLAIDHGDLELASLRLEMSLRHWEAIGQRVWYARALNSLGVVAFRRRELERAATLHEESLEILRSVRQPELMALVLKNAGLALMALGRYDLAKAMLVEQLAIGRALEDRGVIAGALVDLSTVYQNLGNWDKASDLAQEALDIYQDLEDVAGRAYCMQVLGYLSHRADNLEEARSRYEESERLFRDCQHIRGVAEVSSYMAALLEDMDDSEGAERLREQAKVLAASIEDTDEASQATR